MHHAIDNLGADVIFEFDADLSHQPKYIAPMLAQLQNYDVVLGSRYINGGQIPKNWGWHRKCLSVLGNYIARITLTRKYKDFTSGFRATRRQALCKALPKTFISNHYAYKIELLWSLHKNKAAIVEYPIVFVDRTQGESKLPANSIIDSLRVLFTLRFQKFIRYFKMCLVGLSGTLIQYVIYNLLRLKLPPVSAIQIAVLFAILNNFTLNNLFTFKKQSSNLSRRTTKTLGLYIAYSMLMLAFQSYWLYLGISYFGEGYLKENLILISGIVFGSIINYFIYSRFIWRELV